MFYILTCRKPLDDRHADGQIHVILRLQLSDVY